MNDPPIDPLSRNAHCVPRRQDDVDAPLTDAQRDFATMLGRLLADQWHEETTSPRSKNPKANPDTKIEK